MRIQLPSINLYIKKIYYSEKWQTSYYKNRLLDFFI